MTKKIRALINRVNAQKSGVPFRGAGATGPRTAVKHNLTGSRLILQPDETEAYNHLSNTLIAELKPMTELERQAVAKIIDTHFRLNRLAGVENNVFNFGLIDNTTDSPNDDRIEVLIAQTRAWIERSGSFDVLGRYEARLTRQVLQFTRELERLQADRRERAKPDEIKPDTQDPASFCQTEALATSATLPNRDYKGAATKSPGVESTLVTVKRSAIAAALLTVALMTVATAHAALSIMPLKDVRAGMHGTGKTVFNGDKVEDFQVEILGVLENTGPKESLILGRLSGGPLEHTGVMQGMSGSPVYIDGKLIGAVAMAFPYAKDPIAGIRPIEEMFRVDSTQRTSNLRSLAKNPDIASLLPAREATSFGDTRMTEVSTPLSLSGFTSAAVDQFSPQMRKLGLEPRQGISTGGAPEDRMGDPSRLQPGSMISVELMTGDMSVGADGTITAIDGNKVYAFGHRFLAVGPTDLPFTRSEVLALLANVNTSFKISSGRELMGVISQDRDTAIEGSLGKRAALVPLDISVTQDTKHVENYHMKMVNDRYLSPLLLQMALFSAIDGTERATGVSSIVVHGAIEFENRKDPVRLQNIYAGDGGSAMLAATQTAVPLAYLMQAGFDQLKVKRVSLQLESFDVKKELNIAQVYLSRREAKPGDTIELMTQLDGENGVQVTRSLKYTIPLGTAPGTLFFTVADGTQTSLAELKQIIAETPASPEQSISTVGRLRPSDKTYVRVWRAEPAYEVAGEELPDPPPSLALILGSTQSVSQNRNSKITELVIDAGETMVTGSRTVQVEVKE